MADEAKQSGQVDEILNDFNKKNSTMTILIIVFVLITLVGGAGAGYFFLVKGKEKEGEAKEEPKTEAKAEAPAAGREDAKMIGTMVRLDPFIVNLNEVDASRYLKVSIELEVTGEEAVQELEKRSPQIRDITVGVLSSKSFADIQGADGKFRLKEELMFAINKVLVSGQVTHIFFTQFVVQ
jgi:flagellar FliL protein